MSNQLHDTRKELFSSSDIDKIRRKMNIITVRYLDEHDNQPKNPLNQEKIRNAHQQPVQQQKQPKHQNNVISYMHQVFINNSQQAIHALGTLQNSIFADKSTCRLNEVSRWFKTYLTFSAAVTCQKWLTSPNARPYYHIRNFCKSRKFENGDILRGHCYCVDHCMVFLPCIDQSWLSAHLVCGDSPIIGIDHHSCWFQNVVYGNM